jgi:hypothetical protein
MHSACVHLQTRCSTQHGVRAVHSDYLKEMRVVCWQEIQTSNLECSQNVMGTAAVITSMSPIMSFERCGNCLI